MLEASHLRSDTIKLDIISSPNRALTYIHCSEMGKRKQIYGNVRIRKIQ